MPLGGVNPTRGRFKAGKMLMTDYSNEATALFKIRGDHRLNFHFYSFHSQILEKQKAPPIGRAFRQEGQFVPNY
jgi:hypothetical protein